VQIDTRADEVEVRSLVNASIAIAESNAKSSKRVWEGIELMTEIWMTR